jgi:LacI family transcriptional regulator
MPTKRATIYEVADHAGVSHQTVSRYLRHNGGLKPATLARVEAAIAELNYRPNRIARSMRTRRTGRLAILLPGAIQFLPLRLLTAAATVAHDAGYVVDLVALEGDAAARSERADELADSGEFEGILALASWGPHASDDASTAVVTVADYDESMRGIGALADAGACGDVVRHLAGLGHRSLLHLTGDLGFTSARNRRQTFLDTVAELGLRGQVIDGDWQAETAYRAVQQLPADTDVTAIVAANDKVAMGAIRGCLHRGWRVPDDVSVFGWDDEELGRYATPALSTVTIDLERQGARAMRQLLALVRGEQAPEQETSSLHTLIPRESSGPAPVPRVS